MAKARESGKAEYFVYVIPLGRVYWGRRTNRADRAVKLVRRFVERHTKADVVVVTNEVNEYIWARGRKRPPRRIKVIVKVEEVEPEEEEEEGRGKVRRAVVRLATAHFKPGKYEPKAVEAKAGEQRGGEEGGEPGAGGEQQASGEGA